MVNQWVRATSFESYDNEDSSGDLPLSPRSL